MIFVLHEFSEVKCYIALFRRKMLIFHDKHSDAQSNMIFLFIYPHNTLQNLSEGLQAPGGIIYKISKK